MIYLAYAVALLLALVCLFAVLAILMQRPSANAGMGAALGGGAAESAFGGDAANVLNKVTYGLITIFFVLSFGLYLGFLANSRAKSRLSTLDQITQGEPVPTQNPTIAPATEPTPGEPTTPATTPNNTEPATTPPATSSPTIINPPADPVTDSTPPPAQ
ncbi:MAG: preprotein translocase subunit SecG [Puniceicoccales bacterium]|jgi:preprotein translocase subunit SecG|nr:preprotein translocase subunit SecG [Puniceicoccales bacterium]